MGLWQSILQGPRSAHFRADSSTPAQGPGPLSDYWYGPVPSRLDQSLAGVPITPQTALKAAAVFACVRILSEAVASLPIITYERQSDGGKVRAYDHPLYPRLHNQPNPRQTAHEFKSQMMVHLLLRGNAYGRLDYTSPGASPAAPYIWPLMPDDVTPPRKLTDPNVYWLRQEGYAQPLPINGEDILHIRGLSMDGVSGLSVIQYARESLGLTLAAEQYAARAFSQDGTPRGILQHPGNLSREAQDRLRESWAETHSGLQNAHKPAILEEGMTWQSIGLTAEDLQMLQSREFQVADVARWFNVPLHMIQETAKATSWGTGLSELGAVFVIYSLMPWLSRWEERIQCDLMLNAGDCFAEFLLDMYLRGKAVERRQVYTQARNAGAFSVNDILRMENMNPVGPEGDIRLQPANYVPLGQPVADQSAGAPTDGEQ